MIGYVFKLKSGGRGYIIGGSRRLGTYATNIDVQKWLLDREIEVVPETLRRYVRSSMMERALEDLRTKGWYATDGLDDWHEDQRLEGKDPATQK
jgi:hypothetical protein